MGGFRASKSGIRRIETFDTSDIAVQIAGEVRGIDPLECFPLKDRQHVSRTAGLAVIATSRRSRMRACPGELELDARRRIGVVLGTGGGGLAFTERQYTYWFHDQTKKASVYTIPTSTPGTLSSEVSMAFQLHGLSHIVSTGCTSSTDAIFYACDAIVSNRADIVVTGGVDAPLAPAFFAGIA